MKGLCGVGDKCQWLLALMSNMDLFGNLMVVCHAFFVAFQQRRFGSWAPHEQSPRSKGWNRCPGWKLYHLCQPRSGSDDQKAPTITRGRKLNISLKWRRYIRLDLAFMFGQPVDNKLYHLSRRSGINWSNLVHSVETWWNNGRNVGNILESVSCHFSKCFRPIGLTKF